MCRAGGVIESTVSAHALWNRIPPIGARRESSNVFSFEEVRPNQRVVRSDLHVAYSQAFLRTNQDIGDPLIWFARGSRYRLQKGTTTVRRSRIEASETSHFQLLCEDQHHNNTKDYHTQHKHHEPELEIVDLPQILQSIHQMRNVAAPRLNDFDERGRTLVCPETNESKKRDFQKCNQCLRQRLKEYEDSSKAYQPRE